MMRESACQTNHHEQRATTVADTMLTYLLLLSKALKVFGDCGFSIPNYSMSQNVRRTEADIAKLGMLGREISRWKIILHILRFMNNNPKKFNRTCNRSV